MRDLVRVGAVLLLLLPALPRVGRAWTYEVPTTRRTSHPEIFGLSLIVDGQDNVHLGFVEPTDSNHRYFHAFIASRIQGVWSVQRLGFIGFWSFAGTGGCGSPNRPDLFVDDTGSAHSLMTLAGGLPVHLRFDGTSWQRDTFAVARFSTSRPVGAIDPSGLLHYLYLDDAGRSSWFMRNPAGNHLELIDGDSGDINAWFLATPSLAIASDGVPCAALWRGPSADLGSPGYARRENGSWDVETIESTINRPEYLHLRLDPADVPHVVYTTGTWDGAELRYATKVGGVWNVETIESRNASLFEAGLSLNLDGEPEVANISPNALGSRGIVRWWTRGALGWSAEAVDSALVPSAGGDPNFGCALAHFSDGAPVIGYLVTLPPGSPAGEMGIRVALGSPQLSAAPEGARSGQVALQLSHAIAHDRVTVRLAPGTPPGSSLHLVDVTGRRVTHVGEAHLSGAEREWPLELAGVSPGVYFVALTLHGQVLSRARLIIR